MLMLLRSEKANQVSTSLVVIDPALGDCRVPERASSILLLVLCIFGRLKKSDINKHLIIKPDRCFE